MNKIVLSLAALIVTSLLFGCMPAKTAEYITFDAATLRNVTRITDNGLPKGKLAVSKDGTKILYSEAKTNGKYLDDYTIMLIRNINSSAKTTLVTDPSYGPGWFDNGNEYLYVAFEQGKSKIVKSNISGGGKTYVARNPIGDLDLDPSIKGNTILLTTQVNGKTHLVTMNDKGGEVTILGEGKQPSWHPHKNKFVYANPNDGGIYEMDIQDNQVTQLFSVPKNKYGNVEEWCIKPSYSEDGNWILFSKGASEFVSFETKITGILGTSFTTGGGNIETRRWHLFAMREDGSDLSQLTSGNVDVSHPVWGVGNDIFFVANVNSKIEIWRANLAIVRPAGVPLEAAPPPPAAAPAPAPAPAPKRDEGLL